MRTTSQYKEEALNSLRGNWDSPAVGTLVFMLVMGVLSCPSVTPLLWKETFLSNASFLISVLVAFPISTGFANAFRLFHNSGDKNIIENTFKLGFNNYAHIVLGNLLLYIKIVLWTLLLIVPGLIKSFAYAMTPYILVEEPSLPVAAAIRKSEAMMDGHKFDLFYLYLTFIGWFFLAILTAGIGFIWLTPYVQNAVVAFYNDVKSEHDGGIKDATIVSE